MVQTDDQYRAAPDAFPYDVYEYYVWDGRVFLVQ